MTQRGRIIMVGTVAELDRLISGGARRMRGWRVQGLDLRERTAQLELLDPGGALVLGCRLSAVAEEHLRRGGAVVFPEIPSTPVDAYRTTLYTADELYAGLAGAGYLATPDARIYAWSQGRSAGSGDAVAQALHDAAVESALDAFVAGRRVVGVMGAHAVRRDEGDYLVAAELGRALTRQGFLVGTGGGPGAMEAVNLGAYLADHDDAALTDAVAMLAMQPTYRPSVGAWARVGLEVRRRWPDRSGGLAGGLGVPTWFYGHEPPNVFPAAIAKYFQNAVREATLLRRATGGIVFLPGAAGTVQEVFQDACENYYAEPPAVAPMILMGIDHWTVDLPVWPLLQALGHGRTMAGGLALVDTVSDAVAVLRRPD